MEETETKALRKLNDGRKKEVQKIKGKGRECSFIQLRSSGILYNRCFTSTVSLRNFKVDQHKRTAILVTSENTKCNVCELFQWYLLSLISNFLHPPSINFSWDSFPFRIQCIIEDSGAIGNQQESL